MHSNRSPPGEHYFKSTFAGAHKNLKRFAVPAPFLVRLLEGVLEAVPLRLVADMLAD